MKATSVRSLLIVVGVSLCLLGSVTYVYGKSLLRAASLVGRESGKILDTWFAEPKKNWRRLPFSGPCVHAHNRWAWYARRTYGQSAVVEALQRSCAIVQKQHPGFRLAIQDISLPAGGKMLGHISHTQGRDVDIAYIGRDRRGRLQPNKPYWESPHRMYQRNYNAKGRWAHLRFDEELNWAFLMALRANTSRGVEKVLVEPHIRERLLAAGKRLEASSAQLKWAASKLRYAGDNAADHEDHMHVRFKRW